MGLTIAITGAGGFIGRACVDAALARGHSVRALVRRETVAFPAGVETVPCDLTTDIPPLRNALYGADAVIHAAAALSGDPVKTRRDTLDATKALIGAMAHQDPAPRLVLVSSIAVYDATAATVDETTPLEPDPNGRDGYARSKLAQEALLAGAPLQGWIARPGAVFGPGRIWNAHIGLRRGPLLIRLGDDAPIPLIERRSCADALVTAAETPPPGSGMRPVNLIDSDLPDARRYLRALGPAAPRLHLPLPWRALAATGRALSGIPPLRDRLPGLLHPVTLQARFGTKVWSNIRAQRELGLASHQPFESALRAAVLHTGGEIA